MYKGYSRAYTNIALIKYWGKKDTKLIIPKNNSLSLTLDAFYTDTKIEFSFQNQIDQFYLNNQLQSTKKTKKLSAFLDIVREKAGRKLFATIRSYNLVPTAAGLASSSSGYASLASACNQALNLGLSDKDLSRLARRGSGSACRSIFGGFVEWIQGTSDENSYAHEIVSNGFDNELAIIFILVNDQEKKISSRDGMHRTIKTSCYYSSWLKTVQFDLQKAKKAIIEKNFKSLGEISEQNSLKMHATTLAASPPFTYWEPETLKAMEIVRNIRENFIPCYFTIDAGPNIKVLCEKKNVNYLLEKLSHSFHFSRLVTAFSGPGIQNLEMEV